MTDYAGDVEPLDAWQRLQADPAARLVDVRTQPEWRLIGAPDLSSLGRDLIQISWQIWPSMAVDDQFGDKLAKSGVKTGDKLFFLCRAGGRSLAAARLATGLGYRFCYNILSGFEGPLDAQGHRGAVSGWKQAGLPWMQE